MLLLFILSCGLFATLFSSNSNDSSSGSVLASEVVGDCWTTMAPMNCARGNLGVVAVDGMIYAIGGRLANPGGLSESNYVSTTERYDPKSNTWTTLASMPTPRYDFATVVCDGKIYCIGGYGYNDGREFPLEMQITLGVMEAYNIAADSWSPKASLPLSRGTLQTYTMDGKIFALDKASRHYLFVYDPVADSWTTQSDLMNSLGHDLSSAFVDDKLFVTGNFYSKTEHGAPERKVMTYTPKTDTWREGKIGPAIATFTSATGVTTGSYAPQRVYVFCDTGATLVYNPKTAAWDFVAARPTSRGSFGVAVVDDVSYVIGGFTDTGSISLAVNEQYVPVDYGTLSPELGVSLDMVLVVVLTVTIAVVVMVVLLLFFFKNKGKQAKNNLAIASIW